MGCTRPIPAYQAGPGAKLVLWPSRAENLAGQPGNRSENLAVPCTKCVGCLQMRANQWAQRAEHEAKRWNDNIMLTLTYDDKHLPREGYLNEPEVQKFLKRLRKRTQNHDGGLRTYPGFTPRYLYCGEYGTKNGRPHYHLVLFNCGAEERRPAGEDLYEADVFNELWKAGSHTFGDLRGGGANYVAKYTLKAAQRPQDWRKTRGYQGTTYIDYDTGEEVPKPYPFLRMSRNIGGAWAEQYKEDLQHGYMVVGGHRRPIPRAYRKKLELQDPNLSEVIDDRIDKHRRQNYQQLQANTTPERLAAEETIKLRLQELNTRRDL